MKKNIKLILVLVLGFALVNFALKFDSPQALAKKTTLLLYKNKFIAQFLINKNINKNSNTYAGVATIVPLVKNAEAKTEKTYYYKGKKLVISVEGDNYDIDDQTLEFFYQLELLKEKQKK